MTLSDGKPNLKQQAEDIFEKLSPHGLHKSGAITLASLEGVIELLKADTLPSNPRPKPCTITPVNGKVNPMQISGDYRLSAAAYLDFWIRAVHPGAKNIGHTYSWTIYQALRDYCETKVQQPSTVA